MELFPTEKSHIPIFLAEMDIFDQRCGLGLVFGFGGVVSFYRTRTRIFSESGLETFQHEIIFYIYV